MTLFTELERRDLIDGLCKKKKISSKHLDIKTVSKKLRLSENLNLRWLMTGFVERKKMRAIVFDLKRQFVKKLVKNVLVLNFEILKSEAY